MRINWGLVRQRFAHAGRAVPAVLALVAGAALLTAPFGCGNGIFSKVTGSATPTPTPKPLSVVYASNFNDGLISEFSRDPVSGNLTWLAQIGAGAINGPMGLAIDPSNSFLYAANQADGNVYQFAIASDGTLSPIGSGSTGAGAFPQMVVTDPAGVWAYVTNLGSGSISEYSISASDGSLTSIGTVTGLRGPFGIIAFNGGSFITVYVADNTTGLIYTFSVNKDGTLSQLGSALLSLGVSAGRPGLMAIASDSSSANYLFVDDLVAGVVSEFTISSNGTLVFGATYGTASSAKPVGIGVAQNGGTNYLYTANANGGSVQYFQRGGGILTPLGALIGLNGPTGLVADPQGNFVYTGDSGDGTIASMHINGSCGRPLCFVATFNSEKPSNSSAGTQFLAVSH